MREYDVIIGLEVHVQLATRSKIFCGCSTQFGAEPNTQGCPVCLGMPGVLPVLNKQAAEYALRLALAAGCEIQPRSRFFRKNYFYPDLPKGYQISQYQSQNEVPLAKGGRIEIEINGERKQICLVRIHLEEDAGKLVHDEIYVTQDETFFDVNRCGVPLIEVVSEPDLRSSEEAYLYLNKLRQTVMYLGICEGSLERGNIRTDANVNISYREGDRAVRTPIWEIKNMNSFRNAQRAINAAVAWQIERLEAGESIERETLLFDAETGAVRPMRSKEEAHDYHYFPEPDLVPILVGHEWIEEIRQHLPELPTARKDRFVREYRIPEYDAGILTEEKGIAEYYEACVKAGADPKQASNWVMGEVLRVLKEQQVGIETFAIRPDRLTQLLCLIDNKTISGKIAKTVFEEMLVSESEPQEIVQKKGLMQMSDEGEIKQIIEQVIAGYPAEVERYRSGKTGLLGFFVGQVMKETKAKANPQIVNEILKAKLGR
ncbi:MAG: Asp-tRNA(Asn)/Glu-tRNA(Gln) amidotransferase subunit GatB [Candidatus Latescibacteria bacterium]|nr:Asp-tRNA(Asn)/Glu-tRNA(Gln) amidotransferase subunit GatB [Candidatus Latescibacterota bacterium]